MGVQEVERQVISQKEEPFGLDWSLFLQILNLDPLFLLKCTHLYLIIISVS